jgi:hypothetical protein
VIINSASRSGSSLLYALLCRLPQVYALTGEAAPFYKLNTSSDGFNPHVSDRIPTEQLDRIIDYAGLSRDLLSDLSLSETETETKRIDGDAYTVDLMLRLSLQWAGIEFDPPVLRICITRAFECYADNHPVFDTEDFYLLLLEQLHTEWPCINPFYYDIGTDKVALHFPHIEVPTGPPSTSFVLEEPPFILLPPRRSPVPDDLANRTLLLKSTVDCYRMNLIERLFPEAEIRIIHLVRNPAATINGLYDGWLHRGFFSHNLEHGMDGSGLERLHIKGYSDVFPFGKYWWNFDLPDGWQAVADRELVDVCAFQWHAANREILRHLDESQRRSCRVHFEAIICSGESRRSEFERILDFMGVAAEQISALQLDALPVVQSTLPPQLYRWKRREDMISRVLEAPRVKETAACFGYSTENMNTWL